MEKKELLKKAFAMPLTSPSYPKPPYLFKNREYFIIIYRTDLKALQKVVPEPLERILS